MQETKSGWRPTGMTALLPRKRGETLNGANILEVKSVGFM